MDSERYEGYKRWLLKTISSTLKPYTSFMRLALTFAVLNAATTCPSTSLGCTGRSSGTAALWTTSAMTTTTAGLGESTLAARSAEVPTWRRHVIATS